MTRPTVRLISSRVEIRREEGKMVIADKAAGYRRVLTISELTRLADQATTLIHIHTMCEGKIPRRD